MNPGTSQSAKCLQLFGEVQCTGQDLVISKRGRPVAEKAAKPWLSLRGKGSFKVMRLSRLLGNLKSMC
jgi:hypothetical protein